MKCDQDCFNCPFPDCIEDEMTAADYDEARERERERHLRTLDEAAAALLTLGLTREDLAARIMKEVHTDA